MRSNPIILVIAIACLARACPVSAAMLTVNSSTNGNGVFRYVFSRGAATQVWSGMALRMLAYGAVDATASPPWSCALSSDTVRAVCGEPPWFLDTTALTVTIISAFADCAAYNNRAPLYPRGTLWGGARRRIRDIRL